MQTLRSLLLLCFCASLEAGAQSGPIKCTAERNTDNSVTIWAENFSPVDYSIALSFPTLSGYTTNITPGNLQRISPGRSQVARLTMQKASGMLYSYSFSYRFFPGQPFHKKPSMEPVYLLPVSEGTHLQTFHVNSIAQQFGQDTLGDFHALGFRYRIGDTICAARAGIVYVANDKNSTAEAHNQYFNKHRNAIHIQQRDGTLAQYTIPAPIKLLVAVGDEVMPGQPLAVFDKEGEKFEVLFSVSYLDEKKAQALTSAAVPTSPYYTLPTVFHVQETEGLLFSYEQYTAAHPKEIIGKELSKREKKKLGFQ